jgi:hypothetical protein
LGGCGFEVVFLDEPAAEGAADDAGGEDAEDGAGEADGLGVLEAEFFERLAEGEGGGGLMPRSLARRMPMPFCISAAAAARARQTRTCRPPSLRRRVEALRPTVVKKATMDRSRSVVSKVKWSWKALQARTEKARRRPAVMGCGMWRRSRKGMRR